MHLLFGYSWSEIASIFGIISILFSGIYWLIRHGAKMLNNAISAGTFPLQQQSKELINAIKQLNGNFKEQHKDIKRLEYKVEEQDKAILLHDEKIKRLEERK
ncbi:hypothetical protein NYZ94_05470 [Ligilactobacillus salivarius]|nr:hypothetical protein NYZ94_05110 [Ligilactobacillus salivarius]UXI85341.1 hypothetical protein NYZ94_05470 [Ligilactobacillus salivarius]